MTDSSPVETKKAFYLQRTPLCISAVILYLFVRYSGVIADGNVATGIAIFCVSGFLWFTEALPLAVTSLLIPILAVGTGTMDPQAALASFSHPLIFLFLGSFGIAAALSAQKIDRWMAQKLVKLAGGSFRLSCLALWLSAGFISMWVANTATTAMLLPVALGMLDDLDESCSQETRYRATVLILLGLAYSVSLGGITTIIGTTTSAITATHLNLTFSEWLRYGVPAFFILEPVCLFVLWRTLPIDSDLKIKSSEQKEEFEWTRVRVATLIIFLLTVVAWMGSGPLSKALGGVRGLDAMIALTALVIYASTGLVSWKQIDSLTNWGVLLLFGGGLTLGVLMESQYTGGSQFIAENLADFTRAWPTPLIIAAVVYTVIFLTELTSNTAITFLFVPLFIIFANELGFPPEKLAVPVGLAASCAFMMPVGTPTNALVFGSGRLPQREMIRVGFRMNLVIGAVLVLFSLWLV